MKNNKIDIAIKRAKEALKISKLQKIYSSEGYNGVYPLLATLPAEDLEVLLVMTEEL